MSTSGKGKGDQTEKQTLNYGNKRGVRRGHGSEPPRPALTRPAAAAPEPVRDSRPDAHTARPVSPASPCRRHCRCGAPFISAKGKRDHASFLLQAPAGPQRAGAGPPLRVFRNPGSQGAEVVAEGLSTGQACGSFSLRPCFNQKSSICVLFIYRILFEKKNSVA